MSIYNSILFTTLLKIFAIYLWCVVNVFIVVIADITVYLDEFSELYESSLISCFKKAFSTLATFAAGVKFLSMEPKNSISALFVCDNRNGLKNLEHLYVIGELQSILEQHFTSLLRTDDPQVTVHIKNIVWELSDYRRCFLYLNTLPNREFIQVIILLLHLAYYLGLLQCYIIHIFCTPPIHSNNYHHHNSFLQEED